MSAYLGTGESLGNNQFLMSPNLKFIALLQDDGNFVVYQVQGMKPLWATNTNGQTISNAIMQKDGNFVLYNGDGKPVFASNTEGNSDAFLRLQDDGNLVIYLQGAYKWASGTNQ